MPGSGLRAALRRGQATLELAVVLPVLATLAMGVIELGLVVNAYITVVNLGREGVRIAADGATNCEIRAVLTSEGDRRLDFTADGGILIVRGHTSRASAGDTVGSVSPASPAPPNWGDPDSANAWRVDSANPAGHTLRVQRADIRGLELDNSAGFDFVIAEVHYLHRTLTRLPFAQDVPLTSRALIRTSANNTHDC